MHCTRGRVVSLNPLRETLEDFFVRQVERTIAMNLFAIALSIFRESVRTAFYNLLLFAVVLVAASLLVGQTTAGQDGIIKDLGAATSLFSTSSRCSSASTWCEGSRASRRNVLSSRCGARPSSS